MNNDWVKDPKIFQVNRLSPKSSFTYSQTKDNHIANQYVMSLNGKWLFAYARNLENSYDCFYENDYDCSSWDFIQVPGHIQLQGYGKPMYVNQVYPWSSRAQIVPGEIPNENEIGYYVKEVELSHENLLHNIHLCFHGVESAFSLWINGHFVGYSEDSFTPSTFDISPYVQEGVNKIAVKVYRYSSGSWLEDQDFWRFSGIFRDVELLMIPETHVDDILVITPLYDQYAKASIDVSCHLVGIFDNRHISLSLYDHDQLLDCYECECSENIKHSFHLDDPSLWSSENPYLYQLVIEIKNDDELIEVIKQNVGIREFKLIDNIMCINGKRIVFHGVNRHEFSPYHGRVVSYQETKQDLLIMKENNINALRTSHYPNQSFVYDLCDELGLYVIDEVNLETHGTWSELFDQEHILPYDNEDWLPAIIDRANSMYERDKNHPCILMWSLGNESYGGKVLREEADFLRKKDSTRLIHYEGIINDRRYPETSDIESQMYTPASEVKEFIQKYPQKPFILCEYAHAMGNSNGALYKYTQMEKELPLYQGGFIWDFVDQALYDENKILRYGGDFKDRPSDYDFCGNGIVFADRKVTPKMQEVKYCYQFVDMNISINQIEMTNRYLFTNLNQYNFEMTLYCDGQFIEKKQQSFNIAPDQTITIENPFHIDDFSKQYHIVIRVFDKNDHEIAHEQYLYEYHPVKDISISKNIEIIEDYLNIGVQGEGFHMIFSKTKGLVSYEYDGEEMIRTIPTPQFFRPSTNNDIANQYGYRYAIWLTASLYASVHYQKKVVSKTQCQIIYDYHLPRLEKPVSLVYTVFGDGKLTIDMSYQPSQDIIEMPAYGMMFGLFKDYNQVKYFGLRPDENYIDRCKGAILGQYEYNVQENMTQYLYPQECGLRTGVQKLEVTNGRYSLLIEGNIEFSALPYTPFEIENAKHQDELPIPYQTVLCIYEKQMGVAGDNTWGAKTHDEFLLSNKDLHYLHFTMLMKKC